MSGQQPLSDSVHGEAGSSIPDLVERAFKFRGDVTVRLEGDTTIVGYLCNRNSRAREPFAEILDSRTGQKVSFLYRSIRELRFTGRDPAAVSLKHAQAFRDRH